MKRVLLDAEEKDHFYYKMADKIIWVSIFVFGFSMLPWMYVYNPNNPENSDYLFYPGLLCAIISLIVLIAMPDKYYCHPKLFFRK